MAEGSTRVVLVALAGNLSIAAVKLAAFAFTRSNAMLTEAVHSFIDSGDQVLLLIGQSRGARPADAGHPLGYGMETYFWSFIVALMVFLMGGAVSIVRGVHAIAHPDALDRPWVNYIVLGASAVFEGASFMTAYRAYRRTVRGRATTLWRFLRLSKDPGVFSTLLEDGAAVTGLAIAALGVTGAGYLGLRWADGAASILIGLLLVAVALFLGNEMRSLIAGEAAVEPIVASVRGLITADPRVQALGDLATLHLGPQAILVAASVRFNDGLSGEDVRRAALDLSEAVKGADPRIVRVLFSPD